MLIGFLAMPNLANLKRVTFRASIQRELEAEYEFSFLRGPVYARLDVTAFADYRNGDGTHWHGDGSVDVSLVRGAWAPIVDLTRLS